MATDSPARVSRVYHSLQPVPAHPKISNANLVLELPNGAELWASIGGRSRMYEKDLVVAAPPPEPAARKVSRGPRPNLKLASTNGVDDFAIERDIIATILNNNIGMVVSLMNNIIAPTMGDVEAEGQSSFSYGRIQNDEIEEDLASFAPAWFNHPLRNTSIYNYRERVANFGAGYGAQVMPLNADGDVFEFWLNPSTLIRKVRFTSPSAQADVVHVLFRSWQDNGIPINLTTAVERRLADQRGVERRRDALSNDYSDLMGMLKEIYTIQGYYPGQGDPYDLQRVANVQNMLVHCAAGIGRTGTFLTIYYYLYPPNPASLPVTEIINRMRRIRQRRMVYTEEQFEFIDKVLTDVHANREQFLTLLYPTEVGKLQFLSADTPSDRLALTPAGFKSPVSVSTVASSSTASEIISPASTYQSTPFSRRYGRGYAPVTPISFGARDENLPPVAFGTPVTSVSSALDSMFGIATPPRTPPRRK